MPTNQNLPQAVLYHYGEKRLGDAANVLPDTDVRKQGVRELGKKALKVAAGGAAFAASVVFVGHQMDQSPTFKKYRNDHPTEAHTNPQQEISQPLPENPADLPVTRPEQPKLPRTK